MPAIVLAFKPGTVPGGANIFSSQPPNPGINDPHAPKPPPVPDIPRKIRPKPPPSQAPSSSPNPNRALKTSHSRTNYYKPVSKGVVSNDASGRAVVVGESGVSYLLPGAPFEFQYSYSETPKVKPLALREPAFLPFAPPTMNRPWTGKAPLKSKKEKLLKKQRKVRLVKPFGADESDEEDGDDGGSAEGTVLVMSRPVSNLGVYQKDQRSRTEILGKPLSKAEVMTLVKPYLSDNRQVNLGRDGLTHNMLELIHCHWRRQQVCKVRCRGVPTVDMDNVCRCLEERTGGKIIYRVGGVAYLFRGRHYNPNTRPRYPVMLWKPAAPVYPKLIQEAPEGLTKSEAEDFRDKGRKLLPICKLAKNGIYVNLVKDVRDAFEESQLVKIDCKGLEPSDYKKIGAKLKELVPCVLLSFDEEQILMWRGKDWKSKYLDMTRKVSTSMQSGSNTSPPVSDTSGQSDRDSDPDSGTSIIQKQISTPAMLSLWNRAIESNKAFLLDDVQLSPDALLEKVEEFSSLSQAAEHSYSALILPASSGREYASGTESSAEANEADGYSDFYAEDFDGEDYANDNFEDLESTIPIGSIPLDRIVKRLGGE